MSFEKTGYLKHKSNLQAFLEPMPVYVTRKNSDGLIASYSISIGWSLVAMFLVLFNVIGWGIYGLVELVSKVV